MNLLILLSASTVLLLSVLVFPLLDNQWFLKWKWFSSSSVVADFVVTNGFIFTSDPSLPFADSMAVRDGRVLRVGKFSSLQNLCRDETEVMNLDGKVVVPGFIDSHVHLLFGGLQMAQVELHGLNSKDEFIRKVKDAVNDKKHGSWILGGGWNNDIWGGDLPMASWIDDITPNNPVWLSRMDGHMGLANSLSMKMAGITNDTQDPPGGTIMRTIDGEATGLLIDSAMELIRPSIPNASVDERREALLQASNLALQRGVTTVVDFGRYLPGSSVETPWEDLSDVYLWANSMGKMRIRDLIRKTGRVISQWIYLGGVKAFADGSLGSNSALMYEPYIDEPNNYGLQVTDPETLFNLSMAADYAGLQIAVHAIGDRANDLILDMYESVISANAMRERRHRIEHAQHLALGTPERFGKLGVIASVQPEHLLYDANSAIKKLGADRAHKESYLFHSLLASSRQLALGSDWPVVNINPLGGIKTAMKRIPPGWDHAWIPSERITLGAALEGFTISAARACFLDEYLGSLSPGKLADFVILSTDSWDDFVAEGSASVEATYVGGIRAYP
ncbi:Amidohydrolase 3 [Dillenia turbinata]|uniref:Amidohydrolase 3 n=1 Tax=Dillenia turbinata TaxID=194707 RepID=A0AAN8ZHB9_9MAGN